MVRTGAGLVGAYSLVEVEYFAANPNWLELDAKLNLTSIIGAGILVLGAWRLAGGDLFADVADLAASGVVRFPSDSPALVESASSWPGWSWPPRASTTRP